MLYHKLICNTSAEINYTILQSPDFESSSALWLTAHFIVFSYLDICIHTIFHCQCLIYISLQLLNVCKKNSWRTISISLQRKTYYTIRMYYRVLLLLDWQVNKNTDILTNLDLVQMFCCCSVEQGMVHLSASIHTQIHIHTRTAVPVTHFCTCKHICTY